MSARVRRMIGYARQFNAALDNANVGDHQALREGAARELWAARRGLHHKRRTVSTCIGQTGTELMSLFAALAIAAS